MRVIAGRFRGRSLKAPRGEATRPTTDRVREALFGVLGDVAGDRVLDLYAGSGAIGIEALSRGAGHVVFVESARAAVACIRHNLELLDAEPAGTVIPGRVERSGGRLRGLGPFDLVYCDPPWSRLEPSLGVLRDLVEGDRALICGRIVVEHPTRAVLADLGKLVGQPFDRRVYGDTTLSFFRVYAET
jgi:16S rRNA (guanine966-N2)-methyltransferase